jgi:hypothetical protein
MAATYADTIAKRRRLLGKYAILTPTIPKAYRL